MLVAAFVIAAAAALALGAFDRDEEPSRPAAEPPAAATPSQPRAEPREERPERAVEEGDEEAPDPPGDEQEGPSGPPPESDPEREAAAAFRSFVRALADRDAEAVCAAFAPGALRGVEFPDARGDCPASVDASLGFRDRRGLPVWKTSRLGGAISARIDGDQARVVATVVTRYADDREPSVEDDIAYLERRGSRWLLRQPSATFYRAIGVAELPPTALMPPG